MFVRETFLVGFLSTSFLNIFRRLKEKCWLELNQYIYQTCMANVFCSKSQVSWHPDNTLGTIHMSWLKILLLICKWILVDSCNMNILLSHFYIWHFNTKILAELVLSYFDTNIQWMLGILNSDSLFMFFFLGFNRKFLQVVILSSSQIEFSLKEPNLTTANPDVQLLSLNKPSQSLVSIPRTACQFEARKSLQGTQSSPRTLKRGICACIVSDTHSPILEIFPSSVLKVISSYKICTRPSKITTPRYWKWHSFFTASCKWRITYPTVACCVIYSRF